ncbi:unnamed protein product, partial [Ectocarpus sp. 12 AP-2014]
ARLPQPGIRHAKDPDARRGLAETELPTLPLSLPLLLPALPPAAVSPTLPTAAACCPPSKVLPPPVPLPLWSALWVTCCPSWSEEPPSCGGTVSCGGGLNPAGQWSAQSVASPAMVVAVAVAAAGSLSAGPTGRVFLWHPRIRHFL